MYVKEIKLHNFRNYEEQTVTFHERINLITGSNAQGKTNLLESLYITSMGKSFRTSKDKEMIKFSEESCTVKSKTWKDDRDLEIEISYRQDGKIFKIDGVKKNRHADLLEHVYMVIFSPEDLKIVKDEPEKRRRFLDRELCQIKPVYYKNLARYKKILLNRNILLKKQDVNADMLAVYNEGLADYGSRIMLDRSGFVLKLDQLSTDFCSQITNGKEKLKVLYENNLEMKENLNELKECFLKKLEKNIKMDCYRGTTSIGPHKDDLKLTIDDVDIRNYGSQGQQRTAALSLKLAEIGLIRQETGEDAVLLLDDVLSELDYERQNFLLNHLRGVQIFISATGISEVLQGNVEDGYVFKVEKGRVERIPQDPFQIKTLT